MLKGIPVSGGIVIARLLVLYEDELQVKKVAIPADQVEKELERFRQALTQANDEISHLQKGVAKKDGSEMADILGAHLLILEDPLFVAETASRIRKQKVNAEWAIHQVMDEFAETFNRLDDEFMKERLADLRDVGRRVLHVLLERKRPNLSKLKGKVILVAQQLYPSDLAALDTKHILGLVTETGSITSHTAIMARSRNIPAVVGVQNLIKRAASGETAILDAYKGQLLLNPKPEQIKKYRTKRTQALRQEKGLITKAHRIAQTSDGTDITVLGNIEYLNEIDGLLHLGGDGVGLFRSEFLFFNRSELPPEEEQYKVYSTLLRKMGKRQVVVRTADIGGDKFLLDGKRTPEINPGMGLRAIRLGLARREMLTDQICALLRAGVKGDLRIMFPMISSLEEIQRLKKVIRECQEKLRRRKVRYKENIPIGIMIEIPSAAIVLDTLIREIDFVSIGTNDLVQYVLAVERGNQQVAEYYQPFNPAILRLIANVVNVADYRGCDISVCGELAWHPVFIVYFLGLGITRLSMGANAIPEIKKLLRSLSIDECRQHAENMLTRASARAIESYARRRVLPMIHRILPELSDRDLLHLTSV